MILVSWIAATDYRAMRGEAYVGLGPVAQALRARSFSACVLLNNSSPVQADQYLKWVQPKTDTPVHIRHLQLSNSVDYDEVYTVVVSTLEAIRDEHSAPMTFHLSPGTPAMTAVWVLLSQTRFPAALLQSSRQNGVEDVVLPFDVSVDFLPEVLAERDRQLRDRAAEDAPLSAAFEQIVHRCEPMSEVLSLARRVAQRNVPVLIEGESGTGKELLARAIHADSPRRNQSFVIVNCGTIPAEQQERELFGFVPSGSGGPAEHPGHLRAAHRGTLLLDEIEALSPAVQVKLLGVLQSGELTPAGSRRPLPLDVRIIAATSRHLMSDCEAASFRYDLFYRLAVAIIQLPPLRDRQGDLHLLTDHILSELRAEAEELGEAAPSLSAGAMRILGEHRWPGNVRELRNTLRRAALWSAGVIEEDDMQKSLLHPAPSSTGILDRELGEGFVLPDVLAEVARHYLSRAMSEADGGKTEAARLLGLSSYQTLSNWLRKYGLAS